MIFRNLYYDIVEVPDEDEDEDEDEVDRIDRMIDAHFQQEMDNYTDGHQQEDDGHQQEDEEDDDEEDEEDDATREHEYEQLRIRVNAAFNLAVQTW